MQQFGAQVPGLRHELDRDAEPFAEGLGIFDVEAGERAARPLERQALEIRLDRDAHRAALLHLRQAVERRVGLDRFGLQQLGERRLRVAVAPGGDRLQQQRAHPFILGARPLRRGADAAQHLAQHAIVLPHGIDLGGGAGEGLVQAAVGLLHRARHIGERIARQIGEAAELALQFGQLDGARGLVRAFQGVLRQRAHFLADHGKAAAGLARAGRLDGGVERQHAHGVADLGDAGEHALQFVGAIVEQAGHALQPLAHVALGLADAAFHLPHQLGDGLVGDLELLAAGGDRFVEGKAPALHLRHQLVGGVAGGAGVVQQVEAVAQELRGAVPNSRFSAEMGRVWSTSIRSSPDLNEPSSLYLKIIKLSFLAGTDAKSSCYKSAVVYGSMSVESEPGANCALASFGSAPKRSGDGSMLPALFPYKLLPYGFRRKYRPQRFIPKQKDLKSKYDVVIIGGGGHALACAYYLARDHGITDVCILEKGYLAGGNTARNTAIIRSNYLTPEGVRFYEQSLKLYRDLSQDFDFNILYSERGHFTLAHTDAAVRTSRWRAEVNKQLGVDFGADLSRTRSHRLCPHAQHVGRCALPDPGRALSSAGIDRAPRRRRLGLCPRRDRAGRRGAPADAGHRHHHRERHGEGRRDAARQGLRQQGDAGGRRLDLGGREDGRASACRSAPFRCRPACRCR